MGMMENKIDEPVVSIEKKEEFKKPEPKKTLIKIVKKQEDQLELIK